MNAIKKFFIYYAYFIAYFIDIKYKQIQYRNNPDMTRVLNAMLFVLIKHHQVGQKYDNKYPYFYHLKMVYNVAKKFLHIVDFNVNALIGALGHDLIEDTRLTYNDVVELFGIEVADIIYACTELRGKNRAERHGPEYFVGLQNNELGSYDKICDVTANMTHGKNTGSGMLKKYRKEYPKFKNILYIDKFNEMFNDIENNLLTDK